MEILTGLSEWNLLNCVFAIQKHQLFCAQLSLWSNSHIHTWLLEKPIQSFVGKVMSLLFNMLSKLVIAFLPRSKCLFISWLQSPSTVILEPKKIKSVTAFTFYLSICYEVMGLDAIILSQSFFTLLFKPVFSLSFSPSSRSSLAPFTFCH